MRPWIGIGPLMALQLVCGLFLLWNILTSLFGIQTRPIAWVYYELVEIGAVVGLNLGVVANASLLFRARRRQRAAEETLRLASGAFMQVLAERFDEWGLTPAERDVALFAIKGLSVAEIARMRATSEGTVKAQSNAIYRKAGVSGRPQLLSLFIEDLMDDTVAEIAAQ